MNFGSASTESLVRRNVMAESEAADRNYARFQASETVLDGADGYFDQEKERPALSNHSVARLPSISTKDYVRYVKRAEELSKQNGKLSLLDFHCAQFPQWEFELSQGYNILLFGLGSKRDLALSFVNDHLDVDNVLVVNGYNPSTTILEILFAAAGVLLGETRVPKGASDILALVMKSSKPGPPEILYRPKLVLLVNSIDGESLRNDKAQATLSTLASHSDVSVVATVDHINAPFLWDSAKLSLFNFAWHDATTFESYTTELSFWDPLSLSGHTGPGFLNEAGTGQGSAGMRYVLESLTSNARGLYRVLVSNQLQAIEDHVRQAQNPKYDPSMFGLEFKQLYQLCSEEFIVTNELNFRTMLTEFYEHEMLISTKDTIGTEIIYAPFDKEVLERLLEDNILNE